MVAKNYHGQDTGCDCSSRHRPSDVKDWPTVHLFQIIIKNENSLLSETQLSGCYPLL
jgi:hypothetical protein